MSLACQAFFFAITVKPSARKLSGLLRILDDRAARDDAVLGDDDDAVAYVPAPVGGDLVRGAALVHQPDARADARVLFDDGVADDRRLVDADALLGAGRVALHVLGVWVE